MSQRHRRNRRSRFQKPDTINIILGSLTIILLFVWGGLYWKESSQQALIVNADGAALNQQAQQVEPEVVADVPGSTSLTGEAEPLATGKAVESETVDKPVVPTANNSEEQPADNSGEQSADNLAKQPADNSKEQSADKPAKQPAAIPDAGSKEAAAAVEKEESVKPAVPVKTAKPVQTTKPAKTTKPIEAISTKPVAAETPIPATPIVKETEKPINVSEKYEQQVLQLQAKCTHDMNEVLAGAESSIEQMDKSDPYAFQELNQKWTEKLEIAQSTCNTKFQEIIVNAQNAAVEPETTEEWEQTFSTMMLQLQAELEAKMMKLMGG